MTEQSSEMESRRLQAQERRKKESQQGLVKKEDPVPGPSLFGPPIKINRRNDPLRRQIINVLGDPENIHRFIHPSLIGVDRLPQTPAGNFPKGASQLFPMPPSKGVNSDLGSGIKSKDCAYGSNSSKEPHKNTSGRSRSRSKEKSVNHKNSTFQPRSQSVDGGDYLKHSNQSQESGYITGGSLEALNELESQNNKSREKSGSQNRDSAIRSKDKGRRLSDVKSGHDPPLLTEKPASGRKDAAKNLTPLKITNQKKRYEGTGENIDHIIREVSLQPPLTAIQTPGKEDLTFARSKHPEVDLEKNSAGKSSSKGLRRTSSAGFSKDLQVSSDSEEDIQEITETDIKERTNDRTTKKESNKKMRKSSAAQKSLSDSSESSDSDSESDQGSASESSSSDDDEADKKAPALQNKSNSSKNDSAGSGGLFGVPDDQPEEKSQGFSYNLGNLLKQLQEKNSTPDLISPIKDNVPFPSEPSPADKFVNNSNYNEGVERCFEDLVNDQYSKLSPCPTLRHGNEGDKHDEMDVQNTSKSSMTEELKVTSTSNNSATKSRSNSALLRDFNTPVSFGIARITQSDNEENISDNNEDHKDYADEVIDIHHSNTFSPQHSPFKPIHVVTSPNFSAKSNLCSNKIKKQSSISETIPESEAKPPDKKALATPSKSKSKKSQSTSDSKSNQKPVKQDTSRRSNSTKSPAQTAVKSEKKSTKANTNTSSNSAVATPNSGNNTPKNRRKVSAKNAKPISQEFIPSSDSSSEISSPEQEDSDVDIEGLSPDKDKHDKGLYKSSSPKESNTKPSSKSSELIVQNTLLSSPVKCIDIKNEVVENVKNSKSKYKSKQKESTKSSQLLKQKTTSNSPLDLSHILNDVCAPDELLSPVPSVPTLLKHANKKSSSAMFPVDIKPCKNPVQGLNERNSNSVKKEETGADSTIESLGVRFINGVPSIIVSIDLKLVNLPIKKHLGEKGASLNLFDIGRKTPVKASPQQNAVKCGDNIFQNLNKALRLNLQPDNDLKLRKQGYESSNVNPPTLLTPEEEDQPASKHFVESGQFDQHHRLTSADQVSDTFDTNSASDTFPQETVIAGNTETGAEIRAGSLKPKPQPVDVSTIIDLEGLPPPALKIPKKRRQGDSSSSRERIKKPRTDERGMYRDSSPLNKCIESPQYSKRSSDCDRRQGGSRERYNKRCRLEEASVHDESSRSPSIRESPRWSAQGSDYRRTPRYEDYSDRESIHHEDDPWDHGSKERGSEEHGSSTLSSHGNTATSSSRSSSSRRSHSNVPAPPVECYERDRDKWRDRERRDWEQRDRYDRQKTNRKYSRDWDAPGDDSNRSPAAAYSGRGVAGQWGDLAAGHIAPPYRETRDPRHERIYEDDRTHHYRRNKVAPVNEKLESANHYLADAKKLKHQADKIQEKSAQMIVYVDAFLSFIQCGNAMEQDGVSDATKICKMYQDTLKLIRYCMAGQDGSNKPDNKMIKKLSVFSFRIQAVLCLRLYKLKISETAKLKKVIDCHNKSANSKPSVQAPSPYNSHTSSTSLTSTTTQSNSGGWKGTTGTPSPMSPQPSPAGSVGSVGSVGSGDHPKMVNGNVSSTTVCVPQRIHSVTQDYLKNMETLFRCHEAWDQADINAHQDKEFFESLDRDCGRLSLQSNVPEIVRYIKEGIHRLKST